MTPNLWPETGHVQAYLAVGDSIPHRREGEEALLEHLPASVRRVLDLAVATDG